MPVDSPDKRASAILLDLPGRLLPTPDGSIIDLDRQHVAGKYRGIAATQGAFAGNNRASMVLLDLFGRPMPAPDGVVDAGDRQQAAGKYRNILAAPPGGAVAARVIYIPTWRRRRR
jgi:hypothetical protein